jgi:predicted Zn-dependent peptidase
MNQESEETSRGDEGACGRQRIGSEYSGMAHAREHMAFRGCTGMTSDQTAAIYAELGGEDNADTDQTVTRYHTTVPSVDLDVARKLRRRVVGAIPSR